VAPPPAEQSDAESLPEGAPADGSHKVNESESCGCQGWDTRTREDCPDNFYGPLSKKCEENPGTKWCG
jgi:hypothetical protein